MQILNLVLEIPDTEIDFVNCPCEIVANYEDESGRKAGLTLDASLPILLDTWFESNNPTRFNGHFGWDEILCMLLEEKVDVFEDRQMEHVFLEIESMFPLIDRLLRHNLNPLRGYHRTNMRWIGRSCLVTLEIL